MRCVEGTEGASGQPEAGASATGGAVRSRRTDLMGPDLVNMCIPSGFVEGRRGEFGVFVSGETVGKGWDGSP